ncbi:MBL fold metallo-hydrolase [Alphaproteobacteria bacterium]|nr:MBL fold metallo-hydrolase [Alphaproteobacteria bacterium]
MKIRVLGCGGSFGSPLAWGRNGNIDVGNPQNFRTRSSVLISNNNQNILIDTSPDLRDQLYRAKCTKIDAVLFTHEHSDHTAGLPDMRAMSLINKSIIPAYLSAEIHDSIISNYKYIFKGVKDYSPFMTANILEDNFKIDNTEIETFKHNHGSIDVQTFRINNFAYSTDIKNFYENDIDKLKNLDLWIVGLLRYDSHPSHAGFDQILDYINYLKPKKTLFTHMTALLDQKDLLSKCPENVEPAYDGLEITL